MGGIQTNFCSTHGVTADKCFDLHNPTAHRQVGWPSWSAQKDDVVGGFIVTTFPFPASEHVSSRKDEAPTWENRIATLRSGYVIASFMTEKDAMFIADLLNKEKYVPDDAMENPHHWRWVEEGYLEGSLRIL